MIAGAMAALRCVIDSMIFDAIAAEPEMPALVDRLTSARRLELLAAAVAIRQVAATPDPARRKQLMAVRVLVVAPVDNDAGAAARRILDELRARPGVGEDDAQIAATAAAQGVPLVTEDRDLRDAVGLLLPQLALWSWAVDLRPRITALGAAA
jgi:predicted nucleic acid-binding protein